MVEIIDKKIELIKQLSVTAEVLGYKMSDDAIVCLVNDLLDNGFNDVNILFDALGDIRKNEDGRLTFKKIAEYYRKNKYSGMKEKKLLDYKISEQEQANEREYQQKCMKITFFSLHCPDFYKKFHKELDANSRINADGEVEYVKSFIDTAREIVAKNEDIKREAVIFFKQNDADLFDYFLKDKTVN